MVSLKLTASNSKKDSSSDITVKSNLGSSTFTSPGFEGSLQEQASRNALHTRSWFDGLTDGAGPGSAGQLYLITR